MKAFLLSAAMISLVVSVPSPAVAQQPAPTQSDEAAELVEAHAIITIMFPPAERQRMMDKMVADISAPMLQSLPKPAMDDPGLKAIIEDFMTKGLAQQRPVLQKHMPAMFDAMAVAYTREFSLAELKEIHAFARSKAGSHYLSKSTAVVGDPGVQRVNAAMFADIRSVSTEMMPEFKEKILAYLKAHPDLAEKLAGENPSRE